MKNSSEKNEIKPKKASPKGFFSKLWKAKEEKKKVSKSLDNLSSKDENFERDIKYFSENPNATKKYKSLDILNGDAELEEVDFLTRKIESPNNNEEKEDNNNNNDNNEEISPDYNSYHTSLEYAEEPLKKSDTVKSDYKDVLNFDFDFKDRESDKSKDLDLKFGIKKEDLEVVEKKSDISSKGSSHRKSTNLTLLINNKEYVNEVDGLTAKEFADKLYNLEETEYNGKPIALILTETDTYHEETLKYFMENFDFNNVEIDEALRILCKKVVITGETQQIDRILAQFSKHYFDSNPNRQEIFLNEDVTHSIVYSLVLLNTDLHIVYNDNPNKKMTKKEFLRNTMTLLETMTDNLLTAQPKIKSANIPSSNRRSFFGPNSPLSNTFQLTSATIPIMDSQENKQKKWKKQMEQLLGDLYNSIKMKRILQKTATPEVESSQSQTFNAPVSGGSSYASDGSKIQNLFGSEKSSASTFSTMKNFISKSSSRKGKEKNCYLSMPTLNSDAASYHSASDISCARSYDKASAASKSYNGLLSSGVKSNAVIVHKGALNRKHYLDQGKQRAKDRRWCKCHCALFVDQSNSANGICELRIWVENPTKKKNQISKEMDDIFEIAANEPDIETQNIPYLNPNYNESIQITHSVTNIIKTYTSINAIRKNVFSLRLSSGGSYLFEAADENIMKEWVTVLNFWAARKSKEPLRGAVGNMEYGWSQVEKVEKSKTITEEEIQEPIPVYDVFDISNFDNESIKSYTSSTREHSRPNSIRSGRSGNKFDTISAKELNSMTIPEREERPARSFSINRFRSSSRSTSQNEELRSTARSISLNRNDTNNSLTTVSTTRSYSCTRPSHSQSGCDSASSMPPSIPIISSVNSSPRELDSHHGDLFTPITNDSPLNQEPMSVDISDTVISASNSNNYLNSSNTPLVSSSLDTNINASSEDKISFKSSLDQLKLSSIKKDESDNHNLLHRRILSEPQLRIKREFDRNSTKKRSQSLNHYNSVFDGNTVNTTKSDNELTVPPSGTGISSDVFKPPKLEEPLVIPDDENTSHYVTLPYNRSHKLRVASKHQSLLPDKPINVQRFSIQPGSILAVPGGTLTVKKKIKKLRINDWTQPGVGFLLSTLSLEKQFESMKRQYLITEKELEEHKEIKQPMEDLYVFQSTAYQKACNNWKKKYMYLLDEKNKYGLYVNILENYIKDDPKEENVFPVTERKISNASSNFSSTSSLDYSASGTKKSSVGGLSELSPLDEKKEAEPVTQDEIKSILAKKRQQQLDLMKKTATDLSIDSGKLENKLEDKIVLPEIKIGNSLFSDDEYEKEMEELALEQERIFSLNKKD